MGDNRAPEEPRIPSYIVRGEQEYHRLNSEISSPQPKRVIPKPYTDESYKAPKAVKNATFAMDVEDTFDELMDLLLSKHKDYGPSNIADAPGGAVNGLRVRMHDKLARINNLVDNNRDPEHESLEDSFKDMANYAIIGLLVLRGKWAK
jgi:hypothetical protein